MNSKKSHKIFAFIMLVLIIGTVVASALITSYNMYKYKQQQDLQQEILNSTEETEKVN